jgi:hypothetical protein
VMKKPPAIFDNESIVCLEVGVWGGLCCVCVWLHVLIVVGRVCGGCWLMMSSFFPLSVEVVDGLGIEGGGFGIAPQFVFPNLNHLFTIPSPPIPLTKTPLKATHPFTPPNQTPPPQVE